MELSRILLGSILVNNESVPTMRALGPVRLRRMVRQRESLGRKSRNPNIGAQMEWEIRIHNEEKYMEVITKGVADKDGSLNMAKTITETMQQHRITRVLIDHRNIESVSGKIIEIYDRPKLLRVVGIIMGVKIAEIIKLDHIKHFSFFETVCINQGFKISIFRESMPALEWLLQ